MICSINKELSVDCEANPRFGDLGIHEIDRNHGWGRCIGGDLADLLFRGYDVVDGRTILRDPAIITNVNMEKWTEDDFHSLANSILQESFASVGVDCLM